MIGVIAMMVAGHALCDYPLQGDWLSKAKNHNFVLTPDGLKPRDEFMSIAGPEYIYPKGTENIWPLALLSHSAIHGAAVWLITGSLLLGALETVAHALIDFLKCDKVIDYNTDQLLHLTFKGLWVLAMFAGIK